MDLDPLAGVLIDATTMVDPARYAAGAAPPDPLVGAAAVRDTDLPGLGSGGPPVAVLVTGGAGQVAGPAGLCVRRGLPLTSLTVALRDPADLAGNARRVVAAIEDARASGDLDDDVLVRVALPATAAGAGWLAAADEIAAAGLEAGLPTGPDVPAPLVAGWIDALLDRETGFAAAAGDAVGVLAILAAAAAVWDGAGPEGVAAALRSETAEVEALATGRRWCRVVVVPDAAAVAAGIRQRLGG